MVNLQTSIIGLGRSLRDLAHHVGLYLDIVLLVLFGSIQVVRRRQAGDAISSPSVDDSDDRVSPVAEDLSNPKS